MQKTIENFKEKIEQAVEEAEGAFWQAVAAKFPEVTTGDFSPDAASQFSRACELAVLIWLKSNHPDI